MSHLSHLNHHVTTSNQISFKANIICNITRPKETELVKSGSNLRKNKNNSNQLMGIHTSYQI